MKRLHIFVSGKVQGVSYRYYAKLKATELLLRGWIKNIGFDKVEIVVEGEEDGLGRFVKWCKEGPYYASVEDLEIQEEEYKCEFEDFQVRY